MSERVFKHLKKLPANFDVNSYPFDTFFFTIKNLKKHGF